ncbi:FH2 domain-containing protein 1-like [Rhincodon typus]|uniref:FH2 domain-containing protein 1-like n=1 Tax=Rhincodon typus TaxID=259920 RepID=UPI00202E077A|nr:FH2 domain-containing protein 1-like [Rhincodon typus]
MEELFGRRDDQKTLSVRRSFQANSPQRNGVEQVSILDAKKSMNLSIFLKQFKRYHRGSRISNSWEGEEPKALDHLTANEQREGKTGLLGKSFRQIRFQKTRGEYSG